MRIKALCHTCRHQHDIDFDPAKGPGAAFSDWLTKHPGELHDVDFTWPERSGKVIQEQDDRKWMSYIHNANVSPNYAATVSPTITLASLAASSTLLSGRESGAISNTVNKYLDFLLAGHYRTGSANLQAGAIRTTVVGSRDDTPNWPDVFDGTDSAEAVSAQAVYDNVCRIVAETSTDAVQRTWPFGPVALAGFFGGVPPTAFVLFISHSAHTATNVWSATEADHTLRLTGIGATVA